MAQAKTLISIPDAIKTYGVSRRTIERRLRELDSPKYFTQLNRKVRLVDPTILDGMAAPHPLHKQTGREPAT